MTIVIYVQVMHCVIIRVSDDPNFQDRRDHAVSTTTWKTSPDRARARNRANISKTSYRKNY